MNPITKGAVVNLTVTLKQSGTPYAIGAGAAVTATFSTSDGSSILLGPVSVVSTTTGSDWPAGVIVVPLSNAQTDTLPIGDHMMRVSVDTLTWFIPVSVVSAGNNGSAVFPDRQAAVAALRSDQLMMAAETYLSGLTLTDDYIFEKLRAAESSVQHSVRCFLAPTVIIPDDAPQIEVDALEAAGTRYAQEAAYDYEANFFSAEKWGYIVTMQKPLISVASIKFAYPSPIGQIFQIPDSWIRLDRKYGHIRIVPTALSASVPMAAYIMQAISGGMSVPFMIQVRYTAGIKDVHAEYPDLVNVIKRTAVLDILKDAFTPQSGSISADGLSQSVSSDMDKYQDANNKTIASIRDAIHGVRFTVC